MIDMSMMPSYITKLFNFGVIMVLVFPLVQNATATPMPM